MQIQLLTAATATNSAPTTDVQGKALEKKSDAGLVLVRSTAGSGTMTVTIKLWGYSAVTSSWHPMGKHATVATKGIINDGAALEETSADKIAHAELIQGLLEFDRAYAEITAIGGTATAISMWILSRKHTA